MSWLFAENSQAQGGQGLSGEGNKIEWQGEEAVVSAFLVWVWLSRGSWQEAWKASTFAGC